MSMSKVIFNNLFNKYSTRLHPFKKRPMPKAYRGKFNFDAEKCILCGICSNKCPTKCITVDKEKAIWHSNSMACVYCGICAEVCPTKCIELTNNYEEPKAEKWVLEFKCNPRPKKNKDEATKQSKNNEATASPNNLNKDTAANNNQDNSPKG